MAQKEITIQFGQIVKLRMEDGATREGIILSTDIDGSNGDLFGFLETNSLKPKINLANLGSSERIGSILSASDQVLTLPEVAQAYHQYVDNQVMRVTGFHALSKSEEYEEALRPDSEKGPRTIKIRS